MDPCKLSQESLLCVNLSFCRQKNWKVILCLMNITDVLVIDSQRKQGHIKTCWVLNANKIILNLKCLLLFAYHGAVLHKWGSNINPELKTTDRSTVFFIRCSSKLIWRSRSLSIVALRGQINSYLKNKVYQKLWKKIQIM